ncbi:hypothetical protein B0O80DRAFT_110758 [Mortierella sp. GBAus27b]|nr:hypothetical protein B0O80DRAFT_110758 [Mortierella sp. GBAus27b]
MPANQVPVPIMGKTILAFFRGEIFEGKGLICNADGAKIHCYLSHSPPDENTNNHTGLDDPILKDEYSHGNTRYKVRTRIHAESFQGGDDSTYWALRVEVQENENTVFSFVPEPWMRVLTDAVRDPGFLQAVYFLPGGKRFVVIGMQSIQLWSLPTDENRDFNLAFIWSRPRTQVDDSWHKRDGYRTEAVGVHYHCVQRPHIFFDNVTRTVKVRAEMQEGPGKFDTVNIPDDYNTDTRSTFIYCARSIHLLAAAYEYSVYKAKKVPKNLQKLKIAYEKHAEAILRFTRGHINRLLPCEDFVPPKPEDFQDTTRSLGPPGSRSNQRHSGPDRVTSGATLMDHTNKKRDVLKICERDGIEQPKFTTVTTLLLHQDGLKDTNHRFVEKLHDTDSNEWIPHAIKELNPIERAIAVDNEQLLRTLIDHCIKNAKTRHAAYLIPAVQCLDKLLISHPTVLRDLLRRASYVPASSSEYVTSHAVIANVRASDWISFFVRLITFGRYGHNLLSGTKSTNIDDYKNPVFTLRTQLPVTEPNSSQEKRFPEERDGTRPYVNRSREIYVSLLHFYHINLGRRNHSISHVTETDFRESPAIVASLRFEW